MECIHLHEAWSDSMVIVRTLELPPMKKVMVDSNDSLYLKKLKKRYSLTIDSSPGTERYSLWKGGGVDVYGNIYNSPGLTSVSFGSLSFRQNFEKLSFSVAAQAYKGWNPYAGGVYSAYGVCGFSSYSLNDHITLCTFGSYYPGAIGNTSFGGYIDWRISEHWGAELGVEYNYNIFLHQRNIDPIVTPYYRYNDGSKLRIPLGPFVKRGLAELIHNIKH